MAANKYFMSFKEQILKIKHIQSIEHIEIHSSKIHSDFY